MKTKRHFWRWAIASVIFRLILIYFPKNLNLATRPEVSTPVTSLRRRIHLAGIHFYIYRTSMYQYKYFHLFVLSLFFAVAEGYWLTQSSMSPYAGPSHYFSTFT